MVSIDLRDAYLHVPIHGSFRRFLRFGINGRRFEFLVLPFGFSIAPWLFTMLLKPVLAFVHSHGHPFFGYLDDFLASAPSHSLAAVLGHDLASLFLHLCFLIHPRKSNFLPSQSKQYLGAVFCSVTQVVRPPLDRLSAVQALVRSLGPNQHAPLRFWMSLLGRLTALQALTLWGRLVLRSTQFWINRSRHLPLDALIVLPPSIHLDL